MLVSLVRDIIKTIDIPYKTPCFKFVSIRVLIKLNTLLTTSIKGIICDVGYVCVSSPGGGG